MKKKKLKQRISNLESQLVTAKSIAQAREDILYRFLGELEEYGVKTEINTPKPTVIEVAQTEDDVAKYEFGIDTTQPAFSFDFTEHDKKVIVRHGAETCEKWRKIWRDMND